MALFSHQNNLRIKVHPVQAVRDGVRSRAAFKLAEINARYRFLKPGMHVLDLGGAPGGWAQVAAQCVRSGTASMSGIQLPSASTAHASPALVASAAAWEPFTALARSIMLHGSGPADRSARPVLPATPPLLKAGAPPPPADRRNGPSGQNSPGTLQVPSKRRSVFDAAVLEGEEYANPAPSDAQQPDCTAGREGGESSSPRAQLVSTATALGLPHPARAAGGAWARVISVDLLPMQPLPGVLAVQGDFGNPVTQGVVSYLLRHGMADVVLSDMAHSFTGDSALDHDIQMGLAGVAARFAFASLRRNGSLLLKTRQGRHDGTLQQGLQQVFQQVHSIKPPASRSDSGEYFVLCLGFKRSRLTAGVLQLIDEASGGM